MDLFKDLFFSSIRTNASNVFPSLLLLPRFILCRSRLWLMSNAFVMILQPILPALIALPSCSSSSVLFTLRVSPILTQFATIGMECHASCTDPKHLTMTPYPSNNQCSAPVMTCEKTYSGIAVARDLAWKVFGYSSSGEETWNGVLMRLASFQ